MLNDFGRSFVRARLELELELCVNVLEGMSLSVLVHRRELGNDSMKNPVFPQRADGTGGKKTPIKPAHVRGF